jgi:TonB family protein
MELLSYALKVNMVFSSLLACYWLSLRKETWFAARRGWLLAAAVISLILPALPGSTVAESTFTVTLPTVELQAGATTHAGTSALSHLIALHLAISLLLVLRLVVRSIRAMRLVRGPAQEACSFLGMARMPEHVHGPDADAMLHHERVHAEQLHTLDVLLLELLSALFWTNSLWRLALRELRLVHEHAADAVARKHHAHYDHLLLAHALGTRSDTLLHSFRSSNIKTRIAMLYNTRSPRNARPKLLMALPALLFCLVLTSWQAVPLRLPASANSAPVHVDQQPEFPGGQEALMKYLGAEIKYPGTARKEKVEGTVYVGFTVMADGSITQANVKRGVHPDMDAEAVRVISGMPKWKPGMAHGKAVDVQLILPIAFKLGDAK